MERPRERALLTESTLVRVHRAGEGAPFTGLGTGQLGLRLLQLHLHAVQGLLSEQALFGHVGFVFVGQRGFERMMQEAFGVPSGHRDLIILNLLDSLPSLDPFLLREQLKRAGLEPAPCYFSISESDLQRMSLFVEDEIRPLVTLCIGPDLEAVGSTQRLAGKIMSNDPRDRMEALRETLRLAPDDYQEGVFCWKGFLYYKWMLTSLRAEAASVADEVQCVKPMGKVDREAKIWLDRGRAVLRDRIIETCYEAGSTLAVYDRAYAGLTQDGRSVDFRDFLLNAPRLFARLGGNVARPRPLWHRAKQ